VRIVIATSMSVSPTSAQSGARLVALIGLLILFAASALLLTSRNPRPLYDFVLGVNRWAFRVIAYVALMADSYPPFRLDTGPTEVTAATTVAVTAVREVPAKAA